MPSTPNAAPTTGNEVSALAAMKADMGRKEKQGFCVIDTKSVANLDTVVQRLRDE
jgi:hypothetical protein